jgi:hypothetical protein
MENNDKKIKSKNTKSKNTKPKKFCCLDSKTKTKCVDVNSKLNFTKKTKKYPKHSKNLKYAITTFIFGGDNYVPGVLLLGSSIRKVMPNNYKKHFTLFCMVNKDISTEARNLILNVYDKIVQVDYLHFPSNLINHDSFSVRDNSSKNMTKFKIFEMIEYDKILFLDCNMLVLKDDIFSLFNLRTPATIFLGNLGNNYNDKFYNNFERDGKLFNKYQNKYCNWQNNKLHGNLIPYGNNDNEKRSNGMNIKSSVLLIKPNIYKFNEITKYMQNLISQNKQIIHGSEILSYIYKDKLYAIDPRFYGLSINPVNNPDLVIMKIYNYYIQPWDHLEFKNAIKNIDFEKFGDFIYWWNFFVKTYDNEYYKYNNKMLNSLYDNIKHINYLKNIYKTNINIDIGNYLSSYFYYLGLSILQKKNFVFKTKDVKFIQNLPSFINYKNNNIYNHDTIYNELHKKGISLNVFIEKFTYPEELWFIKNNLIYNFWLCMKDIVHKIIDNSLIKSNLKKKVEYPVIHFRCSDTPFVRHPQYHFQKYTFYKEALNKINLETNKNYNKVLLISCSFHKSDKYIKESCDIYTKSLADYLKSIDYDSIIQCHTNIEDFATLFYAPAVISIGSSFSFMSGFFGKGVFISGGHLEENMDYYYDYDTDIIKKEEHCTICDKWLINKYDIKHRLIDKNNSKKVIDYYDTEKVIKILES